LKRASRSLAKTGSTGADAGGFIWTPLDRVIYCMGAQF